MPIYSPTGFLDITNATLRTSNLEAQNFKLNGGNIYVTSELTTDELLNLDNVVNAGNATSNTVQFTNVTTGLVADSNIVVTGNVTAGSFLGDGSGLTSIPPSAITGTLSQWSDGANGDVYIASNVGIGNVHTLTSNTLQVGANLYVRDADANVLTVTGNVAADYFEGDGSKLTGISSTLQAITDSGNVTSNTVQFSNATTGFVTTSNIEVGGALKINTITAAAYHSLQAVTNVGNVTSNTVQFSNATTGLVTTGNVEVGRDLSVTGNLTVLGTRTIVDTDTLRVKDPIIELGKDNPGTGDLGLVMTRPSGSSNVAVVFDESEGTLEIGYTQSNASDTDITIRTAATEPLDVNVNGNVSVGKELTVTGNVAVDTDTLFVDSVNDRVGIGTTDPDSTLQVSDTLTNYKIKAIPLNGAPEGGAYNGYILLAKAATGSIDSESYVVGKILARRGTSGSGHKLNYYDVVSSRGYNNNEILSVNRVGNRTGNDGFTSTVKVTYGGIVYHALRTGTTGGQPSTDLTFWGASKDAALIMVDSSMVSNETSYGHITSSAVNGNVGIGMANPLGKLYIAADYDHTLQRPSSSTNHYLVLSKTGAQVVDEGPGISFCGSYNSANDYQDVMAEIRGVCDTDGGRRGRLEFWTSSSNGINDVDTQAMTIKSNGNVGIGTTNPSDQKLMINGGLYIQRSGTQSMSRDHDANKWLTLRRTGNKVSGEGPGISFQGSYYLTADYNNHMAMIKASGFGNNSLTARLEFLVNDGVGSSLHATDDVAGYFDYDSNGGQVNFTGQHRTFIKDVPFSQAGDLEGLIVSSDQNKYIKMDGGIETGSNAITISEALPVVSLSGVVTDKKCFGVICDSEKSESREDRYGRLFCHFKKEAGDTRVYINSVGEGAIWVTNINGNLESGDYITTSTVKGYGQKQDDDILHNYTVAKITMDCDFEPVTQPIQQIKKELQDVNYWVNATYDNVSEEEYSNLTEENRRFVDDIYQKITNEESKTEQEGWELEVRQEPVNVLDEHGQIQWEDHPTETEKAYKIRYLDANGNITDEANHVHKAAFVGCTYHCG